MKGVLSIILIYVISLIATALSKFFINFYKNKRSENAPKIYYVESTNKPRKKPKRRKDEIAIKGAIIEKEEFNAF